MGYSRACSLSLFRARRPQTFSGSAGAGSTCWPSTAYFAIVDTPFYVLVDLCLNCYLTRLVVRALGHHRPGDTRRLVGQRDCRDVVVLGLRDVRHPATHPIVLARRRS